MSTLNQAVRTYNQRRATEAALTNELVTRQRVERLEDTLGVFARELAAFTALRFGGFWGRLRWLFTGR